MRAVLGLLFILGIISCNQSRDYVSENDDYVLVEFAAKLEEDQEKFKKLDLGTTAP